MKGLVVVDVHVDFYALDDEMKRFVKERWKTLTRSQIDDGDDCIRDAMTAYIMPLATVFANMETLKWTPTCITSEDGFLIAFRRIERLLYIAMSGDQKDTELILTKKLFVLHRVISFLYGPVAKRICPEDLPTREIIWKKLSHIIDCYDRLYWDDLTFLLEAIECVSFSSQLTPHDLKKACSLALDATCVKGVSHAMLIVNNKIALMRSNQRITLSAIDQLLIVLMSNYYNGTAPNVIQASPVTTPHSYFNRSRRVSRNDALLNPSLVVKGSHSPSSPVAQKTPGQEQVDSKVADLSPSRAPDQEGEPGSELEQDREPEQELEREPDHDTLESSPCQTPIHVGMHRTTPNVTQPNTRSGSPIPEEGEEESYGGMPSSASTNDLMRPVEGVYLKPDFEELERTMLSSTNEPSEDEIGTSSGGGLGAIKSQGKKMINYIFGPNSPTRGEDESSFRPNTDEQDEEETQGGFQFEGDENFLSIMKVHHKELVFLRQDVAHGSSVLAVSVPYFLHFITPIEGIVLAFTEEVACGALAVSICSAIAHLEGILQSPTSEPVKVRLDQMDQCVKRISEYMNRLSVGQKVAQTLAHIQSCWTTLKSMNIINVMRRGFNNDTPSERLRNVMENMIKSLITLFEMVFIHSQFPIRLTIEAVMKVVLKTNQVLSPWSHILVMKGLENIPLATCTEQADDLVYYVFVDRRNNRVIAPSLAMLGNTGNAYLDDLARNRGVQAGVYLREKVWMCLHRIQKLLMSGFTSQMWLDDSFHYSFFLLLYHDSDEENDPLKVVEVNKEMDIPPGELTGGFYRRLRVGEGYLLQFYEILCLHEKFTPSSKAIVQSKRLVDNFIRTYLNNPAFRLL